MNGRVGWGALLLIIKPTSFGVEYTINDGLHLAPVPRLLVLFLPSLNHLLASLPQLRALLPHHRLESLLRRLISLLQHVIIGIVRGSPLLRSLCVWQPTEGGSGGMRQRPCPC